jgi:hypothetical protein
MKIVSSRYCDTFDTFLIRHTMEVFFFMFTYFSVHLFFLFISSAKTLKKKNLTQTICLNSGGGDSPCQKPNQSINQTNNPSKWKTTPPPKKLRKDESSRNYGINMRKPWLPTDLKVKHTMVSFSLFGLAKTGSWSVIIWAKDIEISQNKKNP